jgi:hypothetical protein
VWYHEVQVDGKWVKLYDPGKNDNERSPLNELYEELMATGKEADKKLKELGDQWQVEMFILAHVETWI